MDPTPKRSPDIVVLGSGIGSSFLAAVLANQGVDVVVVDHSSHPKFSIGESTIPYLTAVWDGLAHQYGTPELSPLTLREELAAAVGVKENFGFVFHRPHQPARPSEMRQHVNPSRREMHLFRQDVDAQIVYGARRRGVEFRFDTRIVAVEADRAGVRISLEGGDELRSQYVIDGTGYRSVLAHRFGLRDDCPRQRTRSASCFTHMIDVEPFDDIHGDRWHGLPHRFHDGTLHHLFEDGWLWVIPFDNTDMSRNPVVSVGLQVNLRRRGASPPSRDDVIAIINALPDVGRQFRDAKAIRPWVSTGRLQYSSSAAAGRRFCLLPHAYGFVDPLYSRGLCFTFDGIKALIPMVLGALESGDSDTDRFKPLDDLYDELLDHHDDLVHGSYLSFGDSRLWHHWYEVWNLSTRAGEQPLMAAAAAAARSGDHTEFNRWDHKGLMGVHDETLGRIIGLLQAVETGEMTHQAAERLVGMLVESCWRSHRDRTVVSPRRR